MINNRRLLIKLYLNNIFNNFNFMGPYFIIPIKIFKKYIL